MPRKTAGALGCLLLLLVLPALALAEKDRPGSKDHPMFNRMPGTHIIGYRQADFDGYNFNLTVRTHERVEGKFTTIEYGTNKDATKASALEIMRQHQAAIAAIGGQTVYDNKTHVTSMKLIKDGKEIWVQVNAANGRYTLIIVEKKDMVRSITAKAIFDELSQKGFMVIDVHFDTGKATIKPESAPLIEQMAEMLKSNPGLKVAVEGHTDNVGKPQDNQALSQARAKAVMEALIAKGIEAGRLEARGFGDSKPVADNRSDEGRAKNRRVELVKL
ncbi:MAG: OmpA family protein [Desulfarculus sp.]|nr:OmpA family protein [Desulfarculus sp.]